MPSGNCGCWDARCRWSSQPIRPKGTKGCAPSRPLCYRHSYPRTCADSDTQVLRSNACWMLVIDHNITRNTARCFLENISACTVCSPSTRNTPFSNWPQRLTSFAGVSFYFHVVWYCCLYLFSLEFPCSFSLVSMLKLCIYLLSKKFHGIQGQMSPGQSIALCLLKIHFGGPIELVLSFPAPQLLK